jgi:hypothetical protein
VAVLARPAACWKTDERKLTVFSPLSVSNELDPTPTSACCDMAQPCLPIVATGADSLLGYIWWSCLGWLSDII